MHGGRYRQLCSEILRGLGATNMEFIGTHKIGRRKVLRILSGRRQGRNERLLETSMPVMRLHIIVCVHDIFPVMLLAATYGYVVNLVSRSRSKFSALDTISATIVAAGWISSVSPVLWQPLALFADHPQQ